MFGATPMTMDMRRKMALEMARMRAARIRTRGAPTRRLPSALPCEDCEKAFAGVTVPVGLVEMSDATQLEEWLLIARPVSKKEAEKKGGCIRYTPDARSSSAAASKPQYYCITDTDDEVYGRAAYLPRPAAHSGMRKSVSTSSQDCTDEDEDVEGEMNVSLTSRVVAPHRHNSCRCVARA